MIIISPYIYTYIWIFYAGGGGGIDKSIEVDFETIIENHQQRYFLCRGIFTEQTFIF